MSNISNNTTPLPEKTGSFIRRFIGVKEPAVLALLGSGPVKREDMNKVMHYLTEHVSKKTPEEQKNVISMLLFKIAKLGSAPGVDANLIVNILTRRGANIRIKNDSGVTPLMIACKYGNIEIVEALLNKSSATLDDINTRGQNAMYYAMNTRATEDIKTRMIDLINSKLHRKPVFNNSAYLSVPTNVVGYTGNLRRQEGGASSTRKRNSNRNRSRKVRR
jgi:hypothetical protein